MHLFLLVNMKLFVTLTTSVALVTTSVALVTLLARPEASFLSELIWQRRKSFSAQN